MDCAYVAVSVPCLVFRTGSHNYCLFMHFNFVYVCGVVGAGVGMSKEFLIIVDQSSLFCNRR